MSDGPVYNKLDMKYKSFVIFPYIFGYTPKTRYRNLAISTIFIPSLLMIENLQNHFFFQFFNFSSRRNFANKERDWVGMFCQCM